MTCIMAIKWLLVVVLPIIVIVIVNQNNTMVCTV